MHIEVDTSITPQRLVRIFEQLQGARTVHQTGKPKQNADVERFNRIFREELLDQHLFLRLANPWFRA